MPSRKWRIKAWCLVLLIPVSLLVGWFGKAYGHHNHPVRQKVWELVDPNGPAATMYQSRVPFIVMNGTPVRRPVAQASSVTPVDPVQTIRTYIEEYGS